MSWAAFQALEVGVAALGFALDSRGKWWRLLPLVVLQRFCYRQLIYVTALRSLAAALKGQLVGWNKLQRTGGVLDSLPAPANAKRPEANRDHAA
jgi:peptidoglycan-N-acetylglucosamine deacetylase